MKKLLAGLALIVATLAVPSSAHAWGEGPRVEPPAPGCTQVKVTRVVKGKVYTEVVWSCPSQNRIDWD